jgi:L-aminopeptidase/D-esterase-like protein
MTSLPEGVLVGHWTDSAGCTGCTVCLLPEGSVVSCEVRGGAPGTIGTDLLLPSGVGPGANAVLLTGGSAFGLAAAEGVTRWLHERGVGFETPSARVPLVAGAVVYDLGVGSSAARPDAAAGYAACAAATNEPERGSIGVGTGCTVGKLLGSNAWTKGGFGIAAGALRGGGVVAALAAVNAVGEIRDGDGSIIAGIWQDGRYVAASEIVAAAGTDVRRAWSEATTLVCVVTDVALTKTEAWMCARAANAGVARSVSPVWTLFDGDTIFCASTGRGEGDPFDLAVAVADVAAEAIRDGVRRATSAPGCAAAGER